MVTASHNPPDYNGMKFVREQSRPISGDTGLKDIQRIAEADVYSRAGATRPPPRARRARQVHRAPAVVPRPAEAQEAQDRGQRRQRRRRPGRRSARAAPAVRVHQDQSRRPTARSRTACRIRCWKRTASRPIEAIRKHGADCGVAWDGDFDRCFLFDESGAFIEGYYIVGLLASVFLQARARRAHRARSAPDVGDARHGRVARRQGRDVQVRPRIHEGRDARCGRGLRRRDERASLLPPLRLLRQRPDSLAARDAADVRVRQAALGAGRRAHRAASRRAARSTARSPTRRRPSSASRSTISRAHARSISPTAYRSSSTAGASTCASRTPSR